MKKNYYFGIAAALMMGTVALSSCSSDELTVGNEAQIAKEVAKTYSFSVQAVMDNEAGTRVFSFDDLDASYISSKFDENEAVYVFIEKKDESNIAYGCDKVDNTKMALYPTDVSADGASCKIVTDNLTFIPKSPDFEVEVGDKVYLYYGMTVDTNPFDGYFDFKTDGSWESAGNMDYNLAETTIKSVDNGVLTFNDKFSFTNINSIFRQKLTFKNGSSPVNPTIKKVVISSANNKTVKHYYPFGNEAYEYVPIVTEPDLSTGDGSIYFSLIFNDDNKNDAITFTAYDEAGNVYSSTKAAPTGGFKNNMYYYGDAELLWVSDHAEPFITGANLVAENGVFSLGGLYDPTTPITISGNSDGYYITLEGYEGILTLDNVTATYDSGEGFLFDGSNSMDLKLNLNGKNYITCPISEACIRVGGDLTLSCTGSSATLILTSKEPYYPSTIFYSILAGNYSPGNNDDPTVLAADGFSVECTESTDNGDGTFTWTYTVTKNP